VCKECYGKRHNHFMINVGGFLGIKIPKLNKKLRFLRISEILISETSSIA